MNNHIYQIIRTKSINSHKLKFFIDTVDHSSSLKETQELINNVIKIDYNTFLDTVYISQNNSSSFMMKSPKERKNIFFQILNLDEYDQLEKTVKDLKKELINQYEMKQQLLKSLNDKVSYKDEYISKLEFYNKELANINIKQIQEELNNLLQKQKNIESLQTKNQLILNQRNNLQNQILRYRTNIKNNQQNLDKISIENIDELKKQLQSINIDDDENELQQLKEQYQQKQFNLDLLKKELTNLKIKKDNISSYDKETCEFCGNKITEEYRIHYINELNERGKEKHTQYLLLRNELSSLNDVIINKQNLLQQEKKKINNLQEQIQVAIINQNRRNNLIQIINNLNAELIIVEEELNKNLQEKIEELENINYERINKLKQEIINLNGKENECISKIAILKDRLQQIDEYIVKIKQLNKEIKELSLSIEDYKSLVSAFGKDGIPSFIIENTLPNIAEEINNLLKELTDNKISISFIIQKETKAKTMIDTLDIVVNESSVNRKYETFSGGEKFRIDFASHIGLSRFLAKRAGANIDLFVLDENLGSQDETAKQIFIQCINKLTTYFKQIFIITHINDIKDAFTNKLIVKKNEQGSYI